MLQHRLRDTYIQAMRVSEHEFVSCTSPAGWLCVSVIMWACACEHVCMTDCVCLRDRLLVCEMKKSKTQEWCERNKRMKIIILETQRGGGRWGGRAPSLWIHWGGLFTMLVSFPGFQWKNRSNPCYQQGLGLWIVYCWEHWVDEVNNVLTNCRIHVFQ